MNACLHGHEPTYGIKASFSSEKYESVVSTVSVYSCCLVVLDQDVSKVSACLPEIQGPRIRDIVKRNMKSRGPLIVPLSKSPWARESESSEVE
jgi:hypothetical protein